MNANVCSRIRLTHGLLLHGDGVSAARRATRAAAQFSDVEPELGDGAAESVAMHAQLARGLALVSLAVLQHGKNELLLEFANGFGVGDTTFVHLHDQSFQLVFHSASLCFSMPNRIEVPTFFHRCCAMAHAPVPFAAGPSPRESAAASLPARPKSRPGLRPAEMAPRATAEAIPIAERRPPMPAQSQ